MDGKTITLRPAVYWPQHIDSRGEQRLLRFVRHGRRATMANITSSYSGDLELIDTDYLHRIIPNVCELREHHCSPVSSLHGNSIPDLVQMVSAWYQIPQIIYQHLAELMFFQVWAGFGEEDDPTSC
ncbi:hypothetical protein TNCV_3325331 [Trichonephila clavipes]|nr:hypothetical protein TNCV_3325331 [Trichonephila clavipes]